MDKIKSNELIMHFLPSGIQRLRVFCYFFVGFVFVLCTLEYCFWTTCESISVILILSDQLHENQMANMWLGSKLHGIKIHADQIDISYRIRIPDMDRK